MPNHDLLDVTTIQQLSSKIELNCWVVGNDAQNVFPVTISKEETIGKLKDAIKDKKMQAFRDIDADSLVLYKMTVPEDVAKVVLGRIDLGILAGLDALWPTHKISREFSDSLTDNNIYIVIVRPPAAPAISNHQGAWLEPARKLPVNDNPPQSIFDRTYSWLFGPKPPPPTVTIRCIRVPASGSPPRLVDLSTIGDSDNVDCFLRHVPDFRPYWGEGGWRLRDLQSADIETPHSPFRGRYYIFFSFDCYNLPEHKSFNARGDVFIVRVADTEFRDDGWAAYEDVADEMLGSQELVKMLKNGR